MTFFDCNNKYGRPVPYVWFLIFMVSAIPFMVFSGVESTIDCKTVFQGYTEDSYFKSHGFTIAEGKAKCNDLTNQIDTIKPFGSAGIFAILLWRLKPYPLSSPKEDDKS